MAKLKGEVWLDGVIYRVSVDAISPQVDLF